MNFFSYIKNKLLFPWVQGSEDGELSRAVQLFSYFWDVLAQDCVYVRNQFLIQSCADSNLKWWGLALAMPVFDGESYDNYRLRLMDAWYLSSLGGTLKGLQLAVQRALPNIDVQVFIPGANGWKVGAGKVGSVPIGGSGRFEVRLRYPIGVSASDRAKGLNAVNAAKAARDMAFNQAEFMPAGSGFGPWKVGSSKVGSMLVS